MLSYYLFGKEERHQFVGAYGHDVRLTLYPQQVQQAGHVSVLALFQGQLLLTRHKVRGIEWPGGKVEAGETPLEGALRELREETGGAVSSIWLVGQYHVQLQEETFLKNIYVAQVSGIFPSLQTGVDCAGHVLCPVEVQPVEEEGFSPLICDPVFQYVRQAVLCGQ